MLSLLIFQELYNRGFQVPTAIQKYGWPCLKSGEDTTLISPSNTGKTLAYLLPLLTMLELKTSGEMFCVSCFCIHATH